MGKWGLLIVVAIVVAGGGAFWVVQRGEVSQEVKVAPIQQAAPAKDDEWHRQIQSGLKALQQPPN